MLKDSDNLDILEVTFDSKLIFEKHLRSVSRAASQRLGILRKSCRVFHDKLLIGRCFWGFVLPVLEYCSAVWCSAADTHLKLLDSVVSGACFLVGGVLNCDLCHHRSVAVLCMLYKIRYNPKHPLCGCLWSPLCANPGYTRFFDHTLVYFCASPLQNLAVPQDFYSSLSISLEWSGWPRIWWCWIGGFQE